MTNVGRNDPCPCGSGKKFKACCWAKSQPTRKKISAKLLSGKMNLMEKAFGSAIPPAKPLSERVKQGEPKPSDQPKPSDEKLE